MIAASIMEIISIGAVVPFLGVLTLPEQIYQHHLAQPLIQILEITEPQITSALSASGEAQNVKESI
jgi:ATP-binding cassette, subfamily B, bacterial PglK